MTWIKCILFTWKKNLPNLEYPVSLFYPYIVKKDVDYSRFKLLNSNKIDIEIGFNKTIDKESLENSIKLENISDSTIYDNKSYGVIFDWSDNDDKVSLSIPIKSYNSDQKYRLGFKQAFKDKEGHSASENAYIALQPDDLTQSVDSELAENIVFTVAGKK